MADWIRITAEWLEPIYRAMHRRLLAGPCIQADETPVRCNDPDENRGGTTEGCLRLNSRPGDDMVFDWRLSRQHGDEERGFIDFNAADSQSKLPGA